ncbi:hypothetical protein ACHWQZ_G003469 [Mnemiopsis leidyi]
MGDEDTTSVRSTTNGTIPAPSSCLPEEAIEARSSSTTPTPHDQVTENLPSTSRLQDLEPQSRSRLCAESASDHFVSRPRSNASDYASNPRSPRASIDLGLKECSGESSQNGGESSHNATPAKLNLDIDSELAKSLLNGSLTSVDEVELVVEDNEDLIMESPSVHQKEFSPEASSELSAEFAGETGVPGEEGASSGAGSGGSVVSELEPGAMVEPVGRTSSGRDLQLVTPGDTVSDDEGSETVSEVPLPVEDDSEELGAQEYPPEWYTKQKHVFIFSEAGKPIYSRHGKEENIVGLYGVMQALLSCVQDNSDDLNCIRSSDRLFVFRCHPPLMLVAVSDTTECEEQIARQLKYVHHQAVFFLTQSHLARLFKNRHNYDLRRQLTGLPKFFNGIIEFVEEEHSFLLESVQCLPMPQSLRNEVTATLLSNRCPELVFAIVLYERQIISVVRPKQYAITPQDLHLLMNYVQTGSTRGHGEKWAPCCLPDFNDGGYLYIHDSYISETVNVSLVLITNEREQHITMINCKQRIVEQMVAQKTMDKLEEIISTPFLSSDTKIPHLRHFVYKSKSSQQLVSPEYTVPYNSDEDRRSLHTKYCHVYDKLHHSDQKMSIYYDIDSRESVVGYLMSSSEIYCTFSPFVTRPVALNNIDKLLKWIRREENRFFILGSGVY